MPRPETHPCAMPNCCDPETGKPRLISVMMRICRPCRAWNYAHRNQTSQEYARYRRRVMLAGARIRSREGASPLFAVPARKPARNRVPA